MMTVITSWLMKLNHDDDKIQCLLLNQIYRYGLRENRLKKIAMGEYYADKVVEFIKMIFPFPLTTNLKDVPLMLYKCLAFPIFFVTIFFDL